MKNSINSSSFSPSFSFLPKILLPRKSISVLPGAHRWKRELFCLKVVVDTGTTVRFGKIHFANVKSDFDQLKQFNSRIDILNHMDSIGWHLLNGNSPRNRRE
jgi:hypothetical protein